jgi:hypothetical protein
LVAAPLAVALAARVRFLFFTIMREIWRRSKERRRQRSGCE